MVVILIATGGVNVYADLTFGYTDVSGPASGEKSHAEILHDIYGEDFTASGLFEGYEGNGNINAKRVYDFDDEYVQLHLYSGGPDNVDQLWTDGAVTVTAEAKYASYEQAFGWNGGGLGTTYIPLVTDADIGGTPVEIEISGDFLWGYQATSQSWWQPDVGLEWWSLMAENDNSEDHLVTYYIEGLDTEQTVWLVFMEDKRFQDCSPSDLDYNDFVVEIRAVPEPTTICLLGLGGLALLRKRRR